MPLRTALESYDDELKARGVQPILGLLKEMAAIIEADVGAPGSRLLVRIQPLMAAMRA
jgi:hypothetical protein